ncbi:MAG: DsrE family protein [Bdellovibrionota bacterium]
MRTSLNIINTAYRATLEEQDDTSLWLIHAIRKSGLNSDILLVENSVNYGVKSQNPMPLAFGDAHIPFPNKFHEDLKSLIQAGAKVLYITDDAIERGIDHSELIPEIEGISRNQISKLMQGYYHIWHW